MPSTYKTPGVYVEEIPKFPPSVAEVETAIPVFVGFTQKADRVIVSDLSQKPFRITSFLEYVKYYGEAKPQAMEITIDAANEPLIAAAPAPTKYLMYYALRSFFDNGGGPCYIFSVGTYPSADPTNTNLYDDSAATSALNQVKKVDEITLLVFPDLACLSEDNFYAVYKKSLMQCGDLKDRFTIMDVYPKLTGGDLDMDLSVNTFRDKIGTTELKFGAAYFPNLKSTFNYTFLNSDVTLKQAGTPGTLDGLKFSDSVGLLKANSLGAVISGAIEGTTAENKNDRLNLINSSWAEMKATNSDATVTAAMEAAIASVVTDLGGADAVKAATKTALNKAVGDFKDKINDGVKAAATNAPAKTNNTAANVTLLGGIVTDAFQAKVNGVIAKLYVELPPSASMAGIYAYVDSTRGVWKAPANVSVQSTIEPVFRVSDAEQAGLNVSDTGKSINVIRTFTGRGVQVWGARTLAGNDNEWRYVSVRRFFNMAEESVKKASEPFVFEPNDANTWVKVKAMIENFLILQWRAGALAGAKPEHAFYVACGLNQTMTALDILEGRMIIEIGMAVVRPAEFIILRFSHKMQES
ncbi:MAG: phage tail sheath C-terminal domain-containing protein [Bacteroidota bacterium]